MPVPLAFELAAALAPQIYKGVKGIIQGDEADDLKKRNTTPPAFAEALGLGRQAAASLVPGAGAALDRIEGTTNATLSAATKAGTSANSILGLLETSDGNRQRALADLGTREDTYREQKNRELTGLLGKQAAYQQQDQQEFDRNQAALNEAKERNIYGAVDGGSQVAAYFLNRGKGTDTGSPPPTNTLGLPVQPRRSRYNRWGIDDPTAWQ